MWREVRAQAQVNLDLDVDAAFSALVDWPRHGRWVPLTQVERLNELPEVGARFVGVTRLGRLRLNDLMEVRSWQAPDAATPGRVEVAKLGRVLTGSAAFEVSALPAAPGQPPRSRLVWSEQVCLAGRRLPTPLAVVASTMSTLGLRQVLRAVVRDLNANPPMRQGRAAPGAPTPEQIAEPEPSVKQGQL